MPVASMLTFTLIDSFSCTPIYAGIRLHNICLLKWSPCQIGWSRCLKFLRWVGREICKTTLLDPNQSQLEVFDGMTCKGDQGGARDEAPPRFKQSACRITERHLNRVWRWQSGQVWTSLSPTLLFSTHLSCELLRYPHLYDWSRHLFLCSRLWSTFKSGHLEQILLHVDVSSTGGYWAQMDSFQPRPIDFQDQQINISGIQIDALCHWCCETS